MTQWTVFVTIGAVDGKKPMLDKVPAIVDDSIGEDPVSVARAMLTDHAEAVHIPWQRLYYRVYAKQDSEAPYAESTNSPKDR